MSLKDASDLFIKNRSQASQQTKDNYRRHMNMLQDKLGNTMPVTQIREEDIREFCFRAHLAPSTQGSYLRHLKVFFKWLKEKGIVEEDVAKDIKPPRVPENITEKTISREELDLIFEKFDAYNKQIIENGYATKPQHRRVWFKPMISTFYFCGLRAKEAVNLTWNNVDLKNDFIRVINKQGVSTKSGKDRTLPIRKELKPVLKKWYEDQGKPKDGYVFPSATGLTQWHQMNSGSVSRTFKKFVREAGLPESVTLHGLRHTCATELLRKGMPINQVSTFLGHSSVEVTQIYEHLDETDLKKTLHSIE